MKILSIRIKGFQQFQDTFLDFTNPETGEAADKICLIGRNGTGKSTVLRVINDFLFSRILSGFHSKSNLSPYSRMRIESEIHFCIEVDGRNYLGVRGKNVFTLFGADNLKPDYHLNIDIDTATKEEKQTYGLRSLTSEEFNKVSNYRNTPKLGNQIIAYSPSESRTNLGLDINQQPETSLNDALALFNEFPVYHEISNETISDFWKVLVFLVKKREEEREQFETRPENLDKTKKQLIQEFDEQNPKILEKLSEIWNTILDRAGLEFDLENAKSPVQLNDNLKAFIRHKESGQVIQYNELSTGVRNFIFRVGHIFSLYFGRTIEQGFLMVDEPENSLFPDLLLDLIEVYEQATTDINGNRNTQMFFATHSPLVAAQFEPHERVILEWNEVGAVTVSKGVAPVGDDPNDLLIQDFHLSNLMGKAGQKKWEEYLSLKKKLRRSEYPAEKEQLISQINEIGNTYNFDADKPL